VISSEPSAVIGRWVDRSNRSTQRTPEGCSGSDSRTVAAVVPRLWQSSCVAPRQSQRWARTDVTSWSSTDNAPQPWRARSPRVQRPQAQIAAQQDLNLDLLRPPGTGPTGSRCPTDLHRARCCRRCRPARNRSDGPVRGVSRLPHPVPRQRVVERSVGVDADVVTVPRRGGLEPVEVAHRVPGALDGEVGGVGPRPPACCRGWVLINWPRWNSFNDCESAWHRAARRCRRRGRSTTLCRSRCVF
jgi:hypothetical protein